MKFISLQWVTLTYTHIIQVYDESYTRIMYVMCKYYK